MQSLIKVTVLVLSLISLLAFSPNSYRPNRNYKNKSILSSTKATDVLTLDFSFVTKAALSVALALQICNPSVAFADEEKDAKRSFEACYSQCNFKYHTNIIT